MSTQDQEDYDKLLRCTGMMQGAFKIIENACPNPELFSVWLAAKEATHAAVCEFWGAAIKTMPTENPSEGQS